MGLLTASELAAQWRCSKRTVGRLVASGKLKSGDHYVRIGRLLRFRREILTQGVVSEQPKSARAAMPIEALLNEAGI
jgi:excisionase family DNA binding protein